MFCALALNRWPRLWLIRKSPTSSLTCRLWVHTTNTPPGREQGHRRGDGYIRTLFRVRLGRDRNGFAGLRGGTGQGRESRPSLGTRFGTLRPRVSLAQRGALWRVLLLGVGFLLGVVSPHDAGVEGSSPSPAIVLPSTWALRLKCFLCAAGLTAPVPNGQVRGAFNHTPRHTGKSRGRQATGPRLLRDAAQDATRDPRSPSYRLGGLASVHDRRAPCIKDRR